MYVNFNNAIRVDVRRDMTLKELKEYVSAHIVLCRNPKIYFNGLLMQKDQTLAEYGIKERSSLYINTENITGMFGFSGFIRKSELTFIIFQLMLTTSTEIRNIQQRVKNCH